MFNAVSRQAVRDLLLSVEEFRLLTPFFDLLCGSIRQCFCTDHNGLIDFFQQKEGFAQGCPLGPTFASLCLHVPLTKIKNTLQLAAASHLANHASGDDTVGLLGSSMSYLDDTNASLHPADIVPIPDRMQLEGPPLGVLLNCGKTKLMTSTTGFSIAHHS